MRHIRPPPKANPPRPPAHLFDPIEPSASALRMPHQPSIPSDYAMLKNESEAGTGFEDDVELQMRILEDDIKKRLMISKDRIGGADERMKDFRGQNMKYTDQESQYDGDYKVKQPMDSFRKNHPYDPRLEYVSAPKNEQYRGDPPGLQQEKYYRLQQENDLIAANRGLDSVSKGQKTSQSEFYPPSNDSGMMFGLNKNDEKVLRRMKQEEYRKQLDQENGRDGHIKKAVDYPNATNGLVFGVDKNAEKLQKKAKQAEYRQQLDNATISKNGNKSPYRYNHDAVGYPAELNHRPEQKVYHDIQNSPHNYQDEYMNGLNIGMDKISERQLKLAKQLEYKRQLDESSNRNSIQSKQQFNPYRNPSNGRQAQSRMDPSNGYDEGNHHQHDERDRFREYANQPDSEYRHRQREANIPRRVEVPYPPPEHNRDSYSYVREQNNYRNEDRTETNGNAKHGYGGGGKDSVPNEEDSLKEKKRKQQEEYRRQLDQQKTEWERLAELDKKASEEHDKGILREIQSESVSDKKPVQRGKKGVTATGNSMNSPPEVIENNANRSKMRQEIPEDADETNPKDFKMRGYPSEYAYAKALGLMEDNPYRSDARGMVPDKIQSNPSMAGKGIAISNNHLNDENYLQYSKERLSRPLGEDDDHPYHHENERHAMDHNHPENRYDPEDYISPRTESFKLSPPKEARARMLRDIFQDNVVFNDDNKVRDVAAEQKWRPSGKQGNDKQKAIVLDQRAALDEQVRMVRVRKEQEKEREKLEDEKREKKMQEDAAKQKAEVEGERRKKQDMLKEAQQEVLDLQMKKEQEALLRRGKGPAKPMQVEVEKNVEKESENRGKNSKSQYIYDHIASPVRDMQEMQRQKEKEQMMLEYDQQQKDQTNQQPPSNRRSTPLDSIDELRREYSDNNSDYSNHNHQRQNYNEGYNPNMSPQKYQMNAPPNQNYPPYYYPSMVPPPAGYYGSYPGGPYPPPYGNPHQHMNPPNQHNPHQYSDDVHQPYHDPRRSIDEQSGGKSYGPDLSLVSESRLLLSNPFTSSEIVSAMGPLSNRSKYKDGRLDYAPPLRNKPSDLEQSLASNSMLMYLGRRTPRNPEYYEDDVESTMQGSQQMRTGPKSHGYRTAQSEPADPSNDKYGPFSPVGAETSKHPRSSSSYAQEQSSRPISAGIRTARNDKDSMKNLLFHENSRSNGPARSVDEVDLPSPTGYYSHKESLNNYDSVQSSLNDELSLLPNNKISTVTQDGIHSLATDHIRNGGESYSSKSRVISRPVTSDARSQQAIQSRPPTATQSNHMVRNQSEASSVTAYSENFEHSHGENIGQLDRQREAAGHSRPSTTKSSYVTLSQPNSRPVSRRNRSTHNDGNDMAELLQNDCYTRSRPASTSTKMRTIPDHADIIEMNPSSRPYTATSTTSIEMSGESLPYPTETSRYHFDDKKVNKSQKIEIDVENSADFQSSIGSESKKIYENSQSNVARPFSGFHLYESKPPSRPGSSMASGGKSHRSAVQAGRFQSDSVGGMEPGSRPSSSLISKYQNSIGLGVDDEESMTRPKSSSKSKLNQNLIQNDAFQNDYTESSLNLKMASNNNSRPTSRSNRYSTND